MTTASVPPQPKSAPEADGASYNLGRLLRVSANATLISWLFAIVGVLGSAWGIFALYTTYIPWGPRDSIAEMAPGVLIVAFFVLQCFFFSVLMRAVAESVFVIRDIEENTRPHD